MVGICNITLDYVTFFKITHIKNSDNVLYLFCMISVKGKKFSLRGVHLSSVAGLIIKKIDKNILIRKEEER